MSGPTTGGRSASRARVTAVTIALVCAGSGSTLGQERTLRVVDPHDAAIIGAEITVVCEGADLAFQSTTNNAGRVWLPARADCELTVKASGFAPWRGSLQTALAQGSVGLSIAALEERVDVSAAAERRLWAPLASTRLNREDLALIAWDPAGALRYAKALAGTTLGADRVYVDGLPSSGLPPPMAIAESATAP